MYDLIPSQQTMHLMLKYSIHKQVVQIPASFALDKDIDFALLFKALNVEIKRNDCMRLRFRKVDKQVKQYFLNDFRLGNVKILTFKSEEEQEAFFTKDAQTPVRYMNDECYRIYFFNGWNGYKGIYINVSHLVMDAMGIMVFFYDLLNVYRALKNKTKLPKPLDSYEDYIVREQEKASNPSRREKALKFFKEYFEYGGKPFYAGVHGPKFLEETRAKKKDDSITVPPAYNPLWDKAEITDLLISPEDTRKLLMFCQEKQIAPETLLMLGLRCYCSAINYRTPDVFMQLMCSKRITKTDKNMGGCTAQVIQVRTIIDEDKTFSEALAEYLKVRTDLYRHLSFPYTEALAMSREIFGIKAVQGPACLMFSWIPVPITELADFKYEFKTYNLGRYFSPLYVICFPDPETKGLALHYMYRTKLINTDDIDALHKNMIKVLLAGVENPDITMGRLLDMVVPKKES